MAEPFIIAVPDDRLAAIRAKVEAFDWSIMPDAGGWQSGVGLADLKRLVDYWLADYDWRAQERRLNMLPPFTADVQGQSFTSFMRAAMAHVPRCFCYTAGRGRSSNSRR